MPCDLTHFSADDALRLSSELEGALGAAPTTESGARAMCSLLHERLASQDGRPACVLVRYYATLKYGDLPHELQRIAKRAYGVVAFTPPEPGLRCLALLATVGDEDAWNDRRASRAHQAIPLPSPHIVERAPMVAQLIRELGLDLGRFVTQGTVVRDLAGEAFGVFHVEEAAGSPYIPAQSGFVDRHGIRSVLGFGGTLPSGELYAVIMFARVPVPVETADRFRGIALAVRNGLAARERTVFDLPDTRA